MAGRLDERDPRFKHLEVKTGILVLTAIAGMFLVAAIIGIERDSFAKKFSIYFVARSGAGFSEGMPVRISGFKVGRVKDIELTGDARVRVVAKISRRYRKWVTPTTRASLAREGFIGESFVELTPGGGRSLDDGDMVIYEEKGGVDVFLRELRPLLEEIRETVRYVNDPDGDLRGALANTKELVVELRETRRRLDESLIEARGALKRIEGMAGSAEGEVRSTLERANIVLEGVEDLSGRLGRISGNAEEASKRLPAISRKLEDIATDVEEFTETLAEGSPGVAEIIEEGEGMAREGRTLVEGINSSWPFRLMRSDEERKDLVPLDTFVPEGREGLED